jgi:predicted nucleic acid-binding protein
MRYLLDANAVIALLNDTTSPIARRIRRYAPRDVGVSAVVIHELYYGAFKSQRVDKNVARVDALQFRCWSSTRKTLGRPGRSERISHRKEPPSVPTMS